MVKINYPKDIENFKDKYYQKITESSEKYILYNKINDIDIKLKQINSLLTFKELLTASFSELIQYAKEFDLHIQNTIKNNLSEKYKGKNKEYINFLFEKRTDKIKEWNENNKISKKIKKKLDDKYKKELCSILGGIQSILYENKTIANRIADFFMENKKSLNLNTCFYCNIDFINVFQDENNENKNHFTLDHIFPKAEYPFFSISLFNLVPSCSPCNSKFKHTKEFKIEASLSKIIPSSEDYEFNNLIDFRLKDAENYIIMNNEKDLVVELVNLNKKVDEKKRDNIDEYFFIFKLKGRYEYHKGKAFDIIEKRQKYSDTQINEMSKLLGISSNQIKKDIFGKECFESTNQPFEKYKQDIAKQIKLHLSPDDISK